MTNEQLTVNTLRVLSAEAIEKAKSGHPGICLGAAPIGYTLFARHLKHNPKNPAFFDRDRFVLSAGHGSALLYSLLRVFNYGLSKEDLMRFRQHTSKTPGHPEYGVTAGVEVSTGPLGQGIANAVGFALAESILAKRFNKPDCELINHYTYALCGDGCLMEGISNEAASFAGTQKLGKLIVLYDSNHITIEGSTDLAFTEDVGKRHEALGWQVLRVNDGNDIEAISAAITLAKTELDKPSLIIVDTTIGYGSPLAGTSKCHGAPLGAENVKELRKNLGYKTAAFEVPPAVTAHVAELTPTFAKYESDWNRLLKQYKTKYPEDYDSFLLWKRGAVDLDGLDLNVKPEKDEASRASSSRILNQIAAQNPFIVGGSADLAPSNLVQIKDGGDVCPTDSGRNIHFGIREHAMGAICNGMYLHGGLRPFCATFTVFSDYMKGAIRMSAIMGIPVTYILTHDSIGVGEDGPTHQPVEHLTMLRSIPNLLVFRPADAKETAGAYTAAMTIDMPSAIVLSRQTLVQQDNTDADEALFGGYIVSDSKGETPDVILIATGSELDLAVKAQKALAKDKIDARVVSMPCTQLFESQTQKYRDSVLPPSVRARVAIEAGSSMPWHKYVGLDGECCTMDGFGTSAPASLLFDIYGFNVDNVVKLAKKTIRAAKKAETND